MLKWLLKSLIMVIFSLFTTQGEEKTLGDKNEIEAKKSNDTTIISNSEQVKSSAVSENTATDTTPNDPGRLLKEAGITLAVKPLAPTKEMEVLLDQRTKLLKDLQNADFDMQNIVSKSNNWDIERNTEKKGQIDTILDKADRLAFSNEFRVKLTNQAKVISDIIVKINLNEEKIIKQEIADQKKREIEAYLEHIEQLKREKLELQAKIKEQKNQEKMVNSSEAPTTKNEEDIEYFTVTEDTNLQTIALSYYQDHEKWILIYDHPDNKKILKKKDPIALIPHGSVLTIPKIKEE